MAKTNCSENGTYLPEVHVVDIHNLKLVCVRNPDTFTAPFVCSRQ